MPSVPAPHERPDAAAAVLRNALGRRRTCVVRVFTYLPEDNTDARQAFRNVVEVSRLVYGSLGAGSSQPVSRGK